MRQDERGETQMTPDTPPQPAEIQKADPPGLGHIAAEFATENVTFVTPPRPHLERDALRFCVNSPRFHAWAINSAQRLLPAGSYDVFACRFTRKVPYAKIGTLCWCSPAAARKRYQRALETLAIEYSRQAQRAIEERRAAVIAPTKMR